MRYKGGKNADGVYHTIINNFPPHESYIELFLGSGAIMKHKKPARYANVGVEINKDTITRFHKRAKYTVVNQDVIRYLKDCKSAFTYQTLIYIDPPYLMDSRRYQKPIYKYEFTRKQHIQLLTIVTDMRGKIVISAYRNPLYDKMLKGWRRVDYNAGLQGGNKAIESLYMNFPEPDKLHQYNYLGKDCWERQAIKRMINGKVAQLKRLPKYQAQAIIEALSAVQ